MREMFLTKDLWIDSASHVPEGAHVWVIMDGSCHGISAAGHAASAQPLQCFYAHICTVIRPAGSLAGLPETVAIPIVHLADCVSLDTALATILEVEGRLRERAQARGQMNPPISELRGRLERLLEPDEQGNPSIPVDRGLELLATALFKDSTQARVGPQLRLELRNPDRTVPRVLPANLVLVDETPDQCYQDFVQAVHDELRTIGWWQPPATA